MGDCFKPNLGGVSQHNYFKYNKTKFEKKKKKKGLPFSDLRENVIHVYLFIVIPIQYCFLC